MLVLTLTLPRNNQGYGRNKFKLHQSKKKKKKKREESYLIISMLTVNFWPRVIVRLPRLK